MNRPGNEHGGDWASYEIEYGRAPLDFSMNVNPLGIPAEVQAAIAKAGQSAERYPDPLCRGLVQKLAGYENVYVDTSSSLYALSPEEGRRIIRHYSRDRVLFGTDYPMWRPKEELERFRNLKLTDEEEEKILCLNAETLLGS